MRIIKILIYAYTCSSLFINELESKSVFIDRMSKAGILQIVILSYQALEIDDFSTIGKAVPIEKS